MVVQFSALQIGRATGQIVGRLQGTADGAPLTAIRSAAPANIEVIDATAYGIVATGVPTTATLNTAFSFTVGWSQIGPTADPFPTSPISVKVAGTAFPYNLDPATHQATVSVIPEVVGPLTIWVGDQSFTVEVS